MATQNNTQVRDGLGALVTRRSYDKDGARADAPFIPEIGETSDSAWDGTSSAGLIGILKAIWTKLGGIGLKVGASALSVTNPMFVSLSNGASGVTPVTGSLSATGYSAPFTPIPGRPFNFTATGTFVGTLVLERSFDGGVTMVALTALGSPLYTFTGPFSESYTEDESGVQYFIHCTSYTSGTINYRMSA
ncbi:hypothetical protein Xaut_3655 [Xanthobacter versatilis]|uniref:Uncharacterized protein n=1 Tax=Xanthobacter autotrophicus (strain ATCC BAA-1158 / Py2) TaxID=78245 RepID=A7ILJ0_XANP2|nr:hypothetical protein Xaut_3655 [Xanthobacter autotrophicus Py2]